MSLAVIIVSFEVKKLLADCLKSLSAEIKRNKELEVKVVVIDNASTDGSAEMVAEKFTWIKLIKNKKNLGFARAVNLGIKAVEADYYLLLNPDTRVKPGALKALAAFGETHPLAGVVGGRLLDPDEEIQGSCYRLPTLKRAFCHLFKRGSGFLEKYASREKEPVEVEAVTGAVFLIPRKVIKKVGLLDERYFLYFEDLDYCRRVKKAGFKVYYLPEAQFIHHHGASGKAVPEKTHQWLVESSKIYHGILKYYLFTFLLKLGQKRRS